MQSNSKSQVIPASIEFFVPGPKDEDGNILNPTTKGSARAFMFKSRRFPVVVNDNNKNKKWSRVVATHARQAALWCGCPWSGPVELNVRFYLKKPKTAKSADLKWHLKRPDADKLLRSLLDSITQSGIYLDDSQVVSMRVWKEYGQIPGAQVEVINLVRYHEERQK